MQLTGVLHSDLRASEFLSGIIVKNAFWYSPLKSISVRYGSPQLPFFMSEFFIV